MNIAQLIADEEEELREASRVLRRLGYDVRPPATWHDALQAVREEPSDLVLMHVTHTGRMLTDLVRNLRKALETHHRASVIVAAVDARESVGRIAETGVDEIVRWPLDPAEARYRLMKLITQTRTAPLAHAPPGAPATAGVTASRSPVAAAAPVIAQRAPELAPVYHDVSGRADARRLADFFGLEVSELAAATGRPYKALFKTPDAPSAQPALRPLARVADILHGLYGAPAKARAWLNAERPELRNQSPLTVIRQGNGEAVRTLLENVVHGIPV